MVKSNDFGSQGSGKKAWQTPQCKSWNMPKVVSFSFEETRSGPVKSTAENAYSATS